MLRMPVLAVSAFVIVTLFVPVLCLAQSSELDALRSMVKGMEQQLQKALQRIDQLEKEKAGDSARIGQVEKSVKAVQSAPSALNPAIGMAIDATAEHRTKAGGDFNFRAAEVGISASIDPYARGYAYFTG
ncbi:MAG TPA: hypothetical protein VLA17_13145, partial [Candidatus Limnocylindria bacterium]|nr:hypothetical protein [Candidatus Limnocylindria bacterium]